MHKLTCGGYKVGSYYHKYVQFQVALAFKNLEKKQKSEL